MKIAVLTPIPTPYRDPFWQVLSKQPGMELHVFYCASGKSDRPWTQSSEYGFHAEVLKGKNLASKMGVGASCYWNPDFNRRLKEGGYDGLIIGGYNHITMLAAMWQAKRLGIPFFLMNEVYLAQPRSWWRKVVKWPLVRWVMSNASGFFPTGTLSSEYLIKYGADPNRLCRLPNVPDVAKLSRQARELEPTRAQIKSKRGLGPGPVVIFVSRLIQLKRVDLLIKAFAQATQGTQASLLILGDGPKRQEWEEVARQTGIAERIRFEGFIQPADLAEWYATADLFVLPSIDETWSVVALEALASGIPAIVTDLVGCYADAINSPVVGSVVPAGNQDALTKAIRHHLARPVSRAEIEKAWQGPRQAFTYETVASQVTNALSEWCSAGKRRSLDSGSIKHSQTVPQAVQK